MDTGYINISARNYALKAGLPMLNFQNLYNKDFTKDYNFFLLNLPALFQPLHIFKIKVMVDLLLCDTKANCQKTSCVFSYVFFGSCPQTVASVAGVLEGC